MWIVGNLEFRMEDEEWLLQDIEKAFLCITLLNGALDKYRWAQENVG